MHESPQPGVLLADNDAAIRGLLQCVLADRGLLCAMAEDGEQALEAVLAGGVGVLVTDLDMPKLDGRDLLARLGELDAPPASVVISGYLDADLEAALRAMPHVRHILKKPFDVLAFGDLVAGLLQEDS